MRIPEEPPPFDALLARHADDVVELVSRRLDEGRYLHWSETRFRDPPHGWTREQWWLALKLRRAGRSTVLPLLDDRGEPFVFNLPDAALTALHRIDREASGRIAVDERIDAAGERTRYVLASLMEEAITSSQLEGAATTRKAAKEMLRSGRRPRDRDERMVWNNYAAMNWIRERLNEPITPTLVKELHGVVTEGTLDDPATIGQLRATDDVHVIHNPTGAVLHRPPAHGTLPERLERLCAFANGEISPDGFLNPVLRAILVHFQLGYDHPFVDGNGRTARALFYWTLLRADYWLFEFVSISRILKEGPARYARAFLHVETDENDTTYFVLHNLDVILRALDALQTWLSRAVAKTAKASRALRALDDVNPRQVALLQHALRHRDTEYTIAVHQGYHHVSYATARSDLLELADRGLLDQKKRGRKLVFYAADDLAARVG